MKVQRKKRLYVILLVLFSTSVAMGLVLYALRQNINLYLTPSEVMLGKVPKHHVFRLGGMVKRGSVHRKAKTLKVAFVMTDFKKDITVKYNGVLPALFREGQGIIVEGRLNAAGEVIADQVLAKHDAKYKPPVRKVPRKGSKSEAIIF